jgi:hypothetical protein
MVGGIIRFEFAAPEQLEQALTVSTSTVKASINRQHQHSQSEY